MPKNIVICCDGTGNEIGANISNVLKLYRVLSKDSHDQMVFYDPGVGTLARPNPWTKFRQDFNLVLGLATGYGLDDHVLAAYEFLVEHYEEADDIYLFGFSRGAHTVRVLAGFVHMVGLLRRQQRNLAGSAFTAYKQSNEVVDMQVTQSADNRAAQFARIVSTRWPAIKFLGVWDTVASVIVPRPDRCFVPSLQILPYTQRNPCVKVFRHAMAIDERRRMFRLSTWDEKQNFSPRYKKFATSVSQDVKQVWFAGVHSDVGGGYPEVESSISKYPLLWMIEEAKGHGLKVSTQNVNQLVWGVKRQGSPYDYVPPVVTGHPHDSMNVGWRVLECVPKSKQLKEWPARKTLFGCYIPFSEPRLIPQNAYIHESVFIRQQQPNPRYSPVNIPDVHQVVPCNAPPP